MATLFEQLLEQRSRIESIKVTPAFPGTGVQHFIFVYYKDAHEPNWAGVPNGFVNELKKAGLPVEVAAPIVGVD